DPEVRPAGRGRCERHHEAPDAVEPAADSRTTAPAPTRSDSSTCEPGEYVGNQTTSSGISVTTSGKAISPSSVLTVSGAPSATRTACAVASLTRATAGLRVPARCGS